MHGACTHSSQSAGRGFVLEELFRDFNTAGEKLKPRPVVRTLAGRKCVRKMFIFLREDLIYFAPVCVLCELPP